MDDAVLVLNANFEPINVCDIQRALGLMLTEKASLVLNGRGQIHTARTTYPIPSVIRLQNMVPAPRPEVPLLRREIFRRDHFTCQYCGKVTTVLTIDHVVPLSCGGRDAVGRIIAFGREPPFHLLHQLMGACQRQTALYRYQYST